MKFNIAADSFAAAVSSAARIYKGAASDSPVRIAASESSVAIGACDGYRWIETRAECKGAAPATLFLPAQHVAQFAATLSGPAPLAIEHKENRLAIKLGKSTHRLPVIPGADWSIPAIEGARMATTGLRDAIDCVAFAVSSDPSRAYLRGVHMVNIDAIPGVFGSRQPFTAIVASDSHEIACVAVPRIGEFAPLILPDTSLQDIARILTSEDCKIAFSSSLARFETANSTFATKLVGDKFPDFAAVMPKENNLCVVINSDALASALDRVQRVDNKARMYLDSDGMRIEAEHADTGSATEHIAASWNNPPFAYGFKVTGLRAILDSVGSDECALRFRDRGTGMLINPIHNESININAAFVTMPMHIQGL